MNTLPNPAERRLPAGAELLRETTVAMEYMGGLACVATLESGNIDDYGTPAKMDPQPPTYVDFSLTDHGVSDSPEFLPPAGADLMHTTSEMLHNSGNLACVSSSENSTTDADGTGTTNSADPDTMDPRALFDGASNDYVPIDAASLR